MNHWYAVYTQVRNETLACEHLEQQGFEVFFPRYQKQRRHARRTENVTAPLFPRYIFVSFDIERAKWQVIRSTRGVIDLVRNGVEPSSIPADVIEGIKAHQDDTGFVQPGRNLQLSHGDQIRISSSSLSACNAIFDARRDEERVFVLLSLLGREIRTEVPISEVFPLH